VGEESFHRRALERPLAKQGVNEEGLSPDAGEGWRCLVAAVPGVGDGAGLGEGERQGGGVGGGAKAIMPFLILAIIIEELHQDCFQS